MPRTPILATPLVVATLCFATLAGAATSAAHYDRLQALRAEAQAQARAEPGAPGNRKAVATLEGALAYLERPDIAEQAAGSPSLYMKAIDLRMDLASRYAALGRKDEAFGTLQAIGRFALSPAIADMLAGQESLAPLRGEPRFEALLAAHRSAANAVGGQALATPYRDELPVEQRIAGLSLFWAQAREHFAWFDHVPDVDWNRVYLDYLPQVMAAETTAGYYRVLMRLAPLLRDGHTNIYPPGELIPKMFARPPLRTELLENRVIVRGIDSPALRRQLAVGDEIVAIDGQPVHAYASREVAPYVSSSTPQDRAVRTYGYQLLAGDEARPVVLRLRDGAGAERDVTVARGGHADVERPAPTEFRMLPGNVAYLAVNGFDTDAGVRALEAALPQVMGAAGLVLDLRRNGGGNSDWGYELLRYLSREPIRLPLSYGRGSEAYQRAQGVPVLQWLPLASSGAIYGGGAQAPAQVYGGPIAVLTGARTFSAAEDLVAAWQALQRGPTVGTATGGSTGQPLSFDLPGGGRARVCVKRDMRADGSSFVGTGLLPTIEVGETVADVRAGRDPVLERALLALGR